MSDTTYVTDLTDRWQAISTTPDRCADPAGLDALEGWLPARARDQPQWSAQPHSPGEDRAKGTGSSEAFRPNWPR